MNEGWHLLKPVGGKERKTSAHGKNADKYGKQKLSSPIHWAQ